MDILSKRPHEVSIWDDVLVAVDVNGNEHEGIVDTSQYEIVGQYYKEKKICAIGSDVLNSAIHIFDTQLSSKVGAASTLTFSINAKIPNEEGELIDNPFIPYLVNERKVKLKHYPNGSLAWSDFVIKKIDESSENYKFTYTAIDLAVIELSKTGYNIVLDLEKENNMGTVQELGGRVLRGSDWQIGKDSELIQESNPEAVYQISLFRDLTAHDIFTDEEVIIPANSVIYAFYYSVVNKVYDYFQFIYSPTNEYKVDQNGVVYDSGSYYANIDSLESIAGSCEYYNKFRADRYARTIRVVYDPVLEQYVNVYQDANQEWVYCAEETAYITPKIATNLITNNEPISSTVGWVQEDGNELVVSMRPSREENSQLDIKRLYGIYFDSFLGGNEYLLNSGFTDRAKELNDIANKAEYTFRINGGDKLLYVDGTSSINYNGKEVENFVLGANQYFAVEIAKYSYTGGKITKGECLLYGIAFEQDSLGYYYTPNLEFTRALSKEEISNLIDEKIGIFISVVDENGNILEGSYYISHVELFPNFYVEEDFLILPSGLTLDLRSDEISTTTVEAFVDKTYYYYKPSASIKTPEEIEYLYIGKDKSSEFEPVYIPDFEMIRSVSAKESNRFNLIQTIAETFECWSRFTILHKENGEIVLGRDLAKIITSGKPQDKSNQLYSAGGAESTEKILIMANQSVEEQDYYKQQKFVTFHSQIGERKSIGFTYGRNLKSISRSIDSNDIATKLIVKVNSNEFSKEGGCNIARSASNPSGEDFIYDFDYYASSGLLNHQNLQNDLYSLDEDGKWIGLYTRLKNLNNERDKLITEQKQLPKLLSLVNSDLETIQPLKADSEQRLYDQLQTYKAKTGYEYGSLPVDDPWNDDDNIIALTEDIARLQREIEKYISELALAEEKATAAEERKKVIEESLEALEIQSQQLIISFENKYSRFIQEAEWISEDYVDDDLYYFDSVHTLHKAAAPKLTYTINIVELSCLPEYSAYVFGLGDITYVQDTNFFGWENVNGIKTPKKEEVVISEIVTCFDAPEKSTIKAKNYRDSFEDLFQRMNATTQKLQFHSGSYDRAADVVNPEGGITSESLQDAFANNANVLANASNQSVKWDERGIVTTNTSSPNEVTRIVSGGVFLTEDGGQTWTTGITAKGINAKAITTGQLNANKVVIASGDDSSFRWDEKGINAYASFVDAQGIKRYNPNTYVRHDQYGLYGIRDQMNFEPTSVEEVEDESRFSITWKGIRMNNDDGAIVFRADEKGDLEISGTIYANAGKIGGCSIEDGHLKITSANVKGKLSANVIDVGDISAESLLVKDDSGNVLMDAGNNAVNIGGWQVSKNLLYSGANNTYLGLSSDATADYAFWVGANNASSAKFRVKRDGSVSAGALDVTGGSIKISSTFQVSSSGKLICSGADITGKITAEEGKIAGWTIKGNKLTANTFKDKGFIGLYSTFEAGDGNETQNSTNDSATIAGHKDDSWRLIIGPNFGVNNKGEIYASGGSFTGAITATEGGNIGGWVIGPRTIYSSSNTILASNINSIYTTKTFYRDADGEYWDGSSTDTIRLTREKHEQTTILGQTHLAVELKVTTQTRNSSQSSWTNGATNTTKRAVSWATLVEIISGQAKTVQTE